MNINDFCDPNDVRAYLHKPFNLNHRAVATNGHIVLSTPKQEGFEDLNEDEFLKKKIMDVLDNCTRDFKYTPIAKVPIDMPEPVVCSTCDGTKKAVLENCEECNGDGEVNVSNAYSTYHGLGCNSCEGEGRKVKIGGDQDCPDCYGKGKYYSPCIKVPVAGIHVAARYLKILFDEEEEVMIAADIAKKMLLFKSGESVGVIMGMRD